MKYRFHRGLSTLLVIILLSAFTGPQLALAQSQSTVAPTKIVLHKNKYSPMDDVRIGREAAGQAEQKLHIVRDQQLAEYLESVGQGLVRSIPREFQHPEFRYFFRVVNDRSINAFALPGGPMYVNTGAIMAAKNEGELAGVMAHELSHVALRHGTVQATNTVRIREAFARVPSNLESPLDCNSTGKPPSLCASRSATCALYRRITS